jgi:hypothetical protein
VSASGHEERFLPSRLSAGFLLRKETIAGRRRSGRDAPIASVLWYPIEPARAKKSGHLADANYSGAIDQSTEGDLRRDEYWAVELANTVSGVVSGQG